MTALSIVLFSVALQGLSGACSLVPQAALLACESGRAQCCPTAADELLFRDQVDWCQQPDTPRAASLLVRGCDAGDGKSCMDLFLNVAKPGPLKGFDADALRRRALRLLAKKCDESDVDSCTDQAVLLRSGEQDYAATVAATALDRRVSEMTSDLCRGGRSEACLKEALRDLNVTASSVEALRKLEAICRRNPTPSARGEVSACVAASYAPEARMSKQRRATTSRMLEVGCSAGDPRACGRLAAMAIQEGDRSQGLKWNIRACDLGAGFSCHSAADALENIGRAKRSQPWRQKGCSLGVKHAVCPPAPGTCASLTWPPGAFQPLSLETRK